MPANASFTLFEGPLCIAPQAEAMNVRRSGCPEIEYGKAYYGSVVSQSTTSSQISVGAIQAQCYLGDISYWARIIRIVSDGSSNVFSMGANRKLKQIKSEIAPSTSNRGSVKIAAGMHQQPGLAIVALQLGNSECCFDDGPDHTGWPGMEAKHALVPAWAFARNVLVRVKCTQICRSSP